MAVNRYCQCEKLYMYQGVYTAGLAKSDFNTVIFTSELVGFLPILLFGIVYLKRQTD